MDHWTLNRSRASLCAMALFVFTLGCEGSDAAGGGDDGHAGPSSDGGDSGGTGRLGCLGKLLDGCISTDACRVSVPGQFPACYSDGTIVDFQVSNGCTGDGVGRATVTRPDGSVCYTVENAIGYFCESETLTWKNASGQVVATGSFSGDSAKVTCADGTPETICTGTEGCLGSFWYRPKCQQGACP